MWTTDSWFPGGIEMWMKIHAKDRAEAEWKAVTAPPYRCGTLTHDNMNTAPHGAVRGSIPEITALNWRGDVTWTPGGTAIIRGEKGDSTYSGLKEQNED